MQHETPLSIFFRLLAFLLIVPMFLVLFIVAIPVALIEFYYMIKQELR